MTEITTLGLDLAKMVVSLCAEDANGRVVVQRTLRREAVRGWLVQQPPCLVGMEACSSAHWFARVPSEPHIGSTSGPSVASFPRQPRAQRAEDGDDAASRSGS
jgi:hypothetical protein